MAIDTSALLAILQDEPWKSGMLDIGRMPPTWHGRRGGARPGEQEDLTDAAEEEDKRLMKLPACLIVATACLLGAGPAWPATGEYQPAGRIVSLEILHYTSDFYLARHGSVVVKSKDGEQEYLWGGTTCSGKSLPVELVDALVDAQAGKLKVSLLVVPGAGTNECIVGFQLVK